MKITIRVEITTDWDETDTFEICQLEGPYRQLEQEKIRLLLDEGKDVLYTFQRTVVAARAAGNSYAIRIPNRHLSLF